MDRLSGCGRFTAGMSLTASASAAVSMLLLLLLTPAAPAAETANHLSPDEIAEGWKLLFDGNSFADWRGFRQDGFPRHSWVLEDGCLKNLPSTRREGFLSLLARGVKHRLAGRKRTNLISVGRYREFDLRFEVKISPGANTGVKYFVSEQQKKPIGPEYQIIDSRGPDRPSDKKTAALYDLFPASDSTLRSEGFSQGRITVCGDRVEHWLNGKRVLEYRLGSKRFEAAIQGSKFRDTPGFAMGSRGHLVLQDHGDVVWFRNLKILDLSGRCPSH